MVMTKGYNQDKQDNKDKLQFSFQLLTYLDLYQTCASSKEMTNYILF